MMVQDKLITVQEAAKKFGRSEETILRWIRAKKIQGYGQKLGRRGYLVDPDEIAPQLEIQPLDVGENQEA